MIKNNVTCFLFLFLLAPMTVSGADFFTTSGFKFVQRQGNVSFAAEVDFPVAGEAAALRSVKGWICDILEVEEPARLEEGDFQALLQRSFEGFLGVADNCSRRIEIERRYEDADVVTFAALVVDKDSATWQSEDYATFSKVDGHRIQVDEVFKCNEKKIKELMWQWRGNVLVDVSSADGLVVGDVAFLDGWVVVIGPAQGYTGAAYLIRYQDAEPYLKGKPGGRYFER